MGLTLGPVNQVTAEGLPVLFVKDLPPVSTVSLRVTRPQIYYGELANEFVFVSTRQREFDYPSGEANVYAAYARHRRRPGGQPRAPRCCSPPGSAPRRSCSRSDITSDSRVLYYRNIAERAQQGAAVPPVRPRSLPRDRGRRHAQVDPRRLHHVGPLSLRAAAARRHHLHAQQRQAGHRRLRRLAHRLRERPGRSADPDLGRGSSPASSRRWTACRPTCARTSATRTTSSGSRPASTPPTTWTSRRTSTTGRTSGRSRSWPSPQEAVPFMRHIIMRLPDETQAEFIYMVPFTPRGKDNLAAWMVARNDGDVLRQAAGVPALRGRAWCSARSRSRTGSTRTPRSPARSRCGTSAAPR